jgi:hypothetical protein
MPGGAIFAPLRRSWESLFSMSRSLQLKTKLQQE